MRAILGARVGERLDEIISKAFENYRSVLKYETKVAIDAQ